MLLKVMAQTMVVELLSIREESFRLLSLVCLSACLSPVSGRDSSLVVSLNFLNLTTNKEKWKIDRLKE